MSVLRAAVGEAIAYAGDIDVTLQLHGSAHFRAAWSQYR